MITADLVCVMWPNYSWANVIRATLKSPCVHVLRKALNVAISRRFLLIKTIFSDVLVAVIILVVA